MRKISKDNILEQIDIYRQILFAGMFGVEYKFDSEKQSIHKSASDYILEKLDEFQKTSNNFSDDYNIYVDIDNLSNYGTDRHFVESLCNCNDFVFCSTEHFTRTVNEYVVAIEKHNGIDEFAVNESFLYLTYGSFRILFMDKRMVKRITGYSASSTSHYEDFVYAFKSTWEDLKKKYMEL